jgi:hypothetical protein
MFLSKNNISYEEFTKNLKTGDIILYDTRFWYSRLIEYFSNSIYSHVALIIKNPTWLAPNLIEDYYVIESGGEVFNDSITEKPKCGVRVSSLRIVYEQYLNGGYGQLYIRNISTDLCMNVIEQSIKKAYDKVMNDIYDFNPIDWLRAYYDIDKSLNEIVINNQTEKTNTFTCSAFIAYIFVEIGFLDKNIPWTILSPSDFSVHKKRLTFKNCSFTPDKFYI